jgi:predicted dehydrogenase
MKKTKVGFIGCGYMGQLAHIANYAQLENVEMAALAEGRRKTAEAVAGRYGIRKLYADHGEMLEKEKLDAVVAIMGFELHKNVVPEVLDKGLPVLTEKPVSVSSGTAREMLGHMKGEAAIYHIGYMKRCDPASVYAKKMIADMKESGELGKLNYLRVTMPPGDWEYGIGKEVYCGDRADYSNFEKDSPPRYMTEEQGKAYVSFVNYYIHQVNLVRYLLGEDYLLEYADRDGKLLFARSLSGVAVVLEMATYNVTDGWDEFYCAFFDKGWLNLSLPAPMARQHSGEVTVYKGVNGRAVYEKPVFPKRWSMYEQARIFVEEVERKREVISSAADAVKDLEFSESYIKELYG